MIIKKMTNNGKISKSNVQCIFRRVFFINMLLAIVLVIFKDVVLKVNGVKTLAIVVDKQYGGYKMEMLLLYIGFHIIMKRIMEILIIAMRKQEKLLKLFFGNKIQKLINFK